MSPYHTWSESTYSIFSLVLEKSVGMGDKEQHVVQGIKIFGKRVGMGDKQQHVV